MKVYTKVEAAVELFKAQQRLQAEVDRLQDVLRSLTTSLDTSEHRQFVLASQAIRDGLDQHERGQQLGQA